MSRNNYRKEKEKIELKEKIGLAGKNYKKLISIRNNYQKICLTVKNQKICLIVKIYQKICSTLKEYQKILFDI
jgi:hypothetical protein